MEEEQNLHYNNFEDLEKCVVEAQSAANPIHDIKTNVEAVEADVKDKEVEVVAMDTKVVAMDTKPTTIITTIVEATTTIPHKVGSSIVVVRATNPSSHTLNPKSRG